MLDFFDVIAFVIFVTGVIAVIRIYVFQPFAVVGSSMVPTFHEDDFVIVDKISQVKRGDVVVFVPHGQKLPYIKRVVGLPGDTVKLENGGVAICKTGEANSCQKYAEPYLPEGALTEARCGITSFDVTTGGVFVLGDNRGFSTDSRCCFGL
ncbi:signal peptidase I [Patescibacteria group bacterium]|nr:signal peptidase I [Patescibacteria group bacterium]